MKKIVTILILFCLTAVVGKAQKTRVICGDERTDAYLPKLKDKRVALFANHTAVVQGKHILDLLIDNKVNVVGIFAPEHGFRGTADAGEHVKNSTDKKTGVRIFSLYNGKDGMPDIKVLKETDVLVVDIQDVGLRFYTYYISMLQLMNACAKTKTTMMILDRPNPNGCYVDGPVLDMKYKSGVGALPIPVVHGLTLAEMAGMINGEGWLEGGAACQLDIIACRNYTHSTRYKLPIAPSPNLPNMQAIYLYPSICLFEGTDVSLGRGTGLPFQQYGHPQMTGYKYSFIPRSVAGAKKPPQINQLCFGVNLSHKPQEEIIKRGFDLTYVIDAYRNLNVGERFFTPFFTKLVGVDYVQKMIMEGRSNEEIRAVWQPELEKYKEMRRKYLIYKEEGVSSKGVSSKGVSSKGVSSKRSKGRRSKGVKR